MDHDLLSEEDFAGLPRDRTKRFLALERICRRKVSELIRGETGEYYDTAIRLQYMNTVAAAAEELDIPDLTLYDRGEGVISQYNDFLASVTFQTTKLSLRAHSGTDHETVRLANMTRGKIELQIRRLRDMVINSDLPDYRRDGLVAKLNELTVELARPRVRFAVVMGVIAAVSVVVGEATSFLADAPSALMTISMLIGQDKEREEAETLRLEGPPVVRRLAAPDDGKRPAGPAFEPGGMDDDIPF